MNDYDVRSERKINGMIEKIIRHSWNVISGLFVLLLSLWLSGPGIAETDTPPHRWYFMLWFVLWTVGFIRERNGSVYSSRSCRRYIILFPS